jgi:O-antigen/teichoic acid export membrane protein
MIEAVGPVIRFSGAALLAWHDAPVQYFVCVWAFAFWVDQIIVQLPAWRSLRGDLSGVSFWRHRLSDVPIAGLRKFLVAVYWQSNIDSLLRQGPTLLVGMTLGAADAGIYRLARDIADVLRKPVVLIRQAVFPDFARIWLNQPHRFPRVSLQLSGLLTAVGIVFMALTALFGSTLLELLGGPQFVTGAALLSLLVGAAVLELPSGSLRPAAYTLGGERLILALSLVVLLVYLLSFWLLVGAHGSLTPGYAALAAAVVSLSTSLFALWRLLRHPANRARMRASE